MLSRASLGYLFAMLVIKLVSNELQVLDLVIPHEQFFMLLHVVVACIRCMHCMIGHVR